MTLMQTSTQVMTLYLNDVGTYPRLSREQETELATLVARGRAAQHALQQTPPPSTKRCKALENEVARGQEAQQRLIECNLRLVVYWAQRCNSRGLPLEDLVQEGSVGLMEAVERFDPQQGTRLGTYAQWWIRKAIYKAAADHGPLIRLPASANQERLNLRRAAARLEMSLARAPTQAELADELGLPLHRIATIQRWDREYTSLDAPLDTDTDHSLEDVLHDQEQPSPDETVTRLDLRDKLYAIIDAYLAPKERAYLRVRFGLNGGPGQTQSQTARQLGLSQSHAQQIEKRALRQLRSSQALLEYNA
jgi:RNA polymerase sigma factor (sigma-70 family)